MNQAQPIVSVVIPVFNGEQFVEKAIESVQRQTVSDVEIIVIDDGSTDGTRQILEKLERLAGIIWFQQNHEGPSRSRNKGIEASNGKYLALLDCDDIWLPEKLEEQLMIMESRSEVGVVHTDYEVIDGNGVVQEHIAARFSREHLTQAFAGSHEVLTSTILIRQDVLKSVGCLDPELYGSEDSDLIIRLYAATEFECVDRVLVRKLRRGHGYRDMAYDERTHGEKILLSRKKFLSGLERMVPLTTVQRKALDREWANYFLRCGRVAADFGYYSDAKRFYFQSIYHDPFRFRSYTRLLRLFFRNFS